MASTSSKIDMPGLRKSESALCAAFRAWAESQGWVVYPEVSDWDLVLVTATGQVGIQAKLRANLDVLAQCLGAGPKLRAVLVPDVGPSFRKIAKTLGLSVWAPIGKLFVDFGLPQPFRGGRDLVLPPIVTDLPAGVKSPRQLTQWRVRALRLCAILRERGWVTSQDIKACGLSLTYWTSHRGVLMKSERVDGLWRYVPDPKRKMPDVGWEEISKQLAEAKQ
jgi:hypothetical protein